MCTCFLRSVLLEISRLLNTGLDMESLSICVRLCEQGINPEALSSVIKELRKASDNLKVSLIGTAIMCLCMHVMNFKQQFTFTPRTV